MLGNFGYMTNLQYKVRGLQHELESFKTGEKYIQMDLKFRAVFDERNREIARLGSELASAHAETVGVRNHWFQVFGDIQAEHAREIRRLGRISKAFEDRALKAERQVDELKEANLALKWEHYSTLGELEEEHEKKQEADSPDKPGLPELIHPIVAEAEP